MIEACRKELRYAMRVASRQTAILKYYSQYGVHTQLLWQFMLLLPSNLSRMHIYCFYNSSAFSTTVALLEGQKLACCRYGHTVVFLVFLHLRNISAGWMGLLWMALNNKEFHAHLYWYFTWQLGMQQTGHSFLFYRG